MAKVKILRGARENKDGLAPLHAEFCIDRKRVRIPANISLSADEWDPVKEVVKGRGKDIDDLS